MKMEHFHLSKNIDSSLCYDSNLKAPLGKTNKITDVLLIQNVFM